MAVPRHLKVRLNLDGSRGGRLPLGQDGRPPWDLHALRRSSAVRAPSGLTRGVRRCGGPIHLLSAGGAPLAGSLDSGEDGFYTVLGLRPGSEVLAASGILRLHVQAHRGLTPSLLPLIGPARKWFFETRCHRRDYPPRGGCAARIWFRSVPDCCQRREARTRRAGAIHNVRRSRAPWVRAKTVPCRDQSAGVPP